MYLNYIFSHNIRGDNLKFGIWRILFKKIILRKNIGYDIKKMCLNGGILYIKLGQILATMNVGCLFTEDDRKALSSIGDECTPIDFEKVLKILNEEYDSLDDVFKYIDSKPIGSASVSQVHKAVLKNGEEVVLKVKRKDITDKLEEDVKVLKKRLYRYSKLFGIKNLKGTSKALDLYLTWILKETDFKSEMENMKVYSHYLNSVNGKIKGTKKLTVPKLYENYSTNNVIVMEYIKGKTINKYELNEDSKEKIMKAINSYIKLNFWAMFNDEPIAFHGDPHSANIIIDDEGNLVFLDMGLLFTLNSEESKLCRDFFLTIYSKNYNKLYDMLLVYGNLTEKEKKLFKNDLKKYVSSVQCKNVTHYFIDLITVCIKYEIVPPEFLFNMGKAFACVYGICNFTGNEISAETLLRNQIVFYIIKKNFNSFKDGIVYTYNYFEQSTLNLLKDFLCEENTKDILTNALDNLEEIISLIL